MASEQDLQTVRHIVLTKLATYDTRVFLFGSHATGQAARTSDIDVAVWPRSELPTGLLSEIREEIEKSNVPYKVDLIDLSRTDEAFRQRVLQEAVEWTA